MNYEQEYRRKLRTLEEAVQAVKSGDWVDYTTNVCFPTLLDAALARRRDQLTDVKIRGNLLFGPIQTVECDPSREHFCYNSWHCSAYERRLCDRGLCSYIPMLFRNVVPYYRHFLTVNVAMMAVTPMDRHGYFNLSCAAGVAKGILDKADIVILEVNEHLPRIYGGFDECIHIDQVDFIVEGAHPPLPQFHIAPPTEEDLRIADWIVPHIPSGATLQLGIGAIPDAVLLFLKHKKDLGIHSEMFSDGVVELAEAGVITNAKKTLHPGKFEVAFLMGTRRLYDFVDHNPDVELRPVDYINNPFIIAQNDNLVSINSCVQVDLMGQVASESIGPKQISGVGGQVDFVRGASASKGGVSIMAMPSTVKGKISKIVPLLDEGAAITTSRNDVDYVVTEYGVAPLKGRTLRQRARNLIEIAHPDFRDELKAEYEKRFHCKY